MNLIESYFYSKDDIRIFYRKDIPSRCLAIVVIAHGYMEHSGRYIDFAKSLVAHNIGVCILDHRGNGNSEGEEGDIEDFFMFVEDLKILVDMLKIKYNRKMITFGHSMGGLITFLYGLKYGESLEAQIFSSPALGVPIGCKNIPEVLYEWMGHIPGLKFYRGGDEFSVRNKVYLEIFKNDPYRNDYATARFMDQFLRVGVHYALQNAHQYEKKALFLLGEKDHVIPIARNKDILTKIPSGNRIIKIYPACMHDLLHDLDEEVKEIIKDILEFINNTIENNEG